MSFHGRGRGRGAASRQYRGKDVDTESDEGLRIVVPNAAPEDSVDIFAGVPPSVGSPVNNGGTQTVPANRIPIKERLGQKVYKITK